MPFKRPTLPELDARIRSDITGAVRMKGTDTRAASVLRRSVVSVKSRAYAGSCHLLYGYLDNLAKQRFTHSMDDEFLDAEGGMYDMPRKGEDIARGTIAVTGTEGALVLLDRIYQHDSGAQYKVIANNPIAGGSAVITLEALIPGTAGNLLPGEIVRPMQPVASINDEAVVLEPGLTGGIDVEGDDYYRERILDRKRQPPHGGAKHDYVAWALEVPGVTRAWCLPLWMGLGTVGVMIMHDNDLDPFPNEEQCQIVFEHIFKKRPVTADVYVFAAVPFRVDVTVKLSPNTDAAQAAVRDELSDFLFREGKPDEVDVETGSKLYASRISEAISSAVGEHHHYLIDPVNDIHVPANAVPYLGNVVFVGDSEK